MSFGISSEAGFVLGWTVGIAVILTADLLLMRRINLNLGVRETFFDTGVKQP